jgi:hypothetical protein
MHETSEQKSKLKRVKFVSDSNIFGLNYTLNLNIYNFIKISDPFFFYLSYTLSLDAFQFRRMLNPISLDLKAEPKGGKQGPGPCKTPLQNILIFLVFKYNK